MSKVTVQVAVEAMLDHPNDYDVDDIETVLRDAVAVGVSPFYTDPLALVLRQH